MALPVCPLPPPVVTDTESTTIHCTVCQPIDRPYGAERFPLPHRHDLESTALPCRPSVPIDSFRQTNFSVSEIFLYAVSTLVVPQLSIKIMTDLI